MIAEHLDEGRLTLGREFLEAAYLWRYRLGPFDRPRDEIQHPPTPR